MQGVYAVVPTPFDACGAVDEKSLRRVVDLYVADGVDGLTALGVTSEAARLTESEREEILDVVLGQSRVPVVVGVSAGGWDACIEYARRTRDAAAVMVSPPRSSSDAVVRGFADLAEAVDKPIVVQDYPPVSGMTMEPALLARIVREVPRIAAFKLEDPPTPRKCAQILELVEIPILGGLGGAFLLEELLAGAAGTMTGFAYPNLLVRVVRAFREGRVDEAADLFYRHVALMRFEFQEGIGPAIRKEILRRRGAFAHAGVRAPAPGLDGGTRAALDRLLSWLDLVPAAS